MCIRERKREGGREREREREGARERQREKEIELIILFSSLDSISHEDRSITNAQALLRSAWLGDAVSVKKHLVSY